MFPTDSDKSVIVHCPLCVQLLAFACHHDALIDELLELTSSSQEIKVNMYGIGQDMRVFDNKDISSIYREFERNGIDSSFDESTNEQSVESAKSCSQSGNEKLQPELGVEESSEERQVEVLKPYSQKRKENALYCVFCYNNGERETKYLSHKCRDKKGNVTCSKLRRYVCPICKATGKQAHTKKYCPMKPIIKPEDLLGMGYVGDASRYGPNAKRQGGRHPRF
ncbi:nanos homolog 3-like [Toxorhynchites rutilus septentrionalis]|uniref:nanos homolog 3-like n=1 Tax=Toxorhynchites rutilus septentrionalis TaxID=329112 RepID=UPI002479C771|nr:nanos homolog 3-like [Toxorhynchites rutilus septentrionalis]